MVADKYSYKNLIIFALPTIFSSLLEPIAGVIDTALVGNLNTQWLAALAVATVIFSSITWVFNFIVFASTQTVSVSRAKGNWYEFGNKLRLSTLVALGIGLCITFVLLIFKASIYSLMGIEDQLMPLVDEYYDIRVFGQVFVVLYVTFLSILRGMEKINLAFIVVSITTLSNVVISYLALYHFEMGIEGAAFGTVISNVIGVVFILIYFLTHSEIRSGLFGKFEDIDHVLTFKKNSCAMFGRSFFLTGSFLLATRLATAVGVEELAAHQVMMQLWLLSSFLVDGIALSATIIGAGHFAQKEWSEFKLVSDRYLVIGGILGLVFAVMYLFAPSSLYGLFSNDENVIFVLGSLTMVLALSQVHNALAFVYDGIIFGMEGFDYLRKHMAISAILLFLPMALWGYFEKSLVIIWLGHALLNLYRFESGRRYLKKIKA